MCVQVTAGMLSNGRVWESKGELRGGAGPPAQDVAEELLEDANCGGSQKSNRCAHAYSWCMIAEPFIASSLWRHGPYEQRSGILQASWPVWCSEVCGCDCQYKCVDGCMQVG
jgi:hypothetical protein